MVPSVMSSGPGPEAAPDHHTAPCSVTGGMM